jgi:hypothetical protein
MRNEKKKTNIPRVTVANDLNIDVFTSYGEEDILDKVLVHPWFKLSHPYH